MSAYKAWRLALTVVGGALALPLPAAASDVYVANQTSGDVSVIDAATNTVVGDIDTGGTPFQVALTPDGGRAYVTDVTGPNMSVLDTATRTVLPPVTVGGGQTGVAVAPNGSRVYVAGGSSNTVSVIDTATDTVVGSIPVGTNPRAVAVSPDGERVYVTNQDANTVSVIDADAGMVVATIPVGAQPVAITVTPDGRRVYVASAFGTILGGPPVAEIDTATNTVVSQITFAFPFAIAVAPAGDRVYVASSQLAGFGVPGGAPKGSVTVANGLGPFAVSPDGARAYLPSNALNAVAVVDTAAMSVLATINVGQQPSGVAIAPDRGPSAAFVSANASAGVTAFDARTSSDPDSPIVRYDWDFGDGTTAPDGGPSPTHIYAAPGTYPVTLTVTDADGCSTRVVFTGQTASCNGGPKATVARSVTIGTAPPPECDSGSVSVPSATPTDIALSCHGDIDMLRIVTAPDHGHLTTIDQQEHTVIYTPDQGFSGADRIRFAANGRGGSSAPATIRLTIGAPPPSSPPAAPTDLVAPVLRSLRLDPPRFQRRTTVRYGLSEAASTRFTVERGVAGRRVGGRCVRATHPNRGGRACIRYVRLPGNFLRAGRAGDNRFRFSGRLQIRPLGAGAYRLLGVPTDLVGNRGRALRADFRIVRRPRAPSASAAGSNGGHRGQEARSPKLPHLSIAQLAGLRVVAAFRDAGIGQVPAALARRIRAGTIGAVCLFAENGRTVATIRGLTRKLQAIPRPAALREPLLIMIDQEGGQVRRLTDSPPHESALQMTGTHDPRRIRARGVATARGLRRAGVNVDLAPVADVPRRGSTLLEFQRTFGTDPRTVGAYAAAFASGLVAGGVQATAKHFPGFGAAQVNSDNESVSIGLDAHTLRTVDEPSFRRVVKAGAQLLMVNNAIYPALDATAPATLSRRIATAEVRRHLGLQGVTITDDLEAAALRQYGDAGQLAVKGAVAGDDLVLFARNYSSSEQAASALRAAIKSGRLSMTDARAAAERILALRRAVAAAQ